MKPNNDVYTAERQAWVREQHALGRRIEPGPDVHILTRKVYVPAALTDITKTFAKAREAMGVA